MLPKSPSTPEHGTRPWPDSSLHDLAELALPNAFLPLNRLGNQPHSEWMSALHDGTEIVVADAAGKPCSTRIEKAVSIVQSRSYLEARARQLLIPLDQRNGIWHLVTIDLGLEALQHECEFLMCFAFQTRGPAFSGLSPYVEVGFALPARTGIGPMFVLTIQTVLGIER